ncbi:MAG: sodium-dependent bicarbonate transport family permease [Betaproteobacteria bacterium]|nr:sodium-dependent bicarbonate transport family permease [Betaproteobacteria bacterium]
MDPVILFFLLGFAARFWDSDLKLPEALYETLSIYLLLAIGLKGGVELAKHPMGTVLPQAAAAMAMGACLPLLAYPALRHLGRLNGFDAASIAGHYGSVSVVTFAVGVSFLVKREVAFEEYMPLFVALMEVPGIVVGILLARMTGSAAAPAVLARPAIQWGALAHEIFLGKSVVLLGGGLAIGWFAGPSGLEPMSPLFFGLFKGVLALFLLEMGLVAAARIGDFRRAGPFLIGFGVITPVLFGAIGVLVGRATGLSVGGATLLGVLAASASYIAAPAAMRIAIPEANPTLSIVTALGVTFPFNLTLGIPLYHEIARRLIFP